MPRLTCPVCKKRFEQAASSSLPFCGPRCKQIDLGRWLSEDYAVPNRALDEEDADDQCSAPPPEEDNH